jgi:hypothetical protein
MSNLQGTKYAYKGSGLKSLGTNRSYTLSSESKTPGPYTSSSESKMSGSYSYPWPVEPEPKVLDPNPSYDPRNTTSFLRMPTKNNPMMNVPIVAYDAKQNYADYERYDKYDEAMDRSTRKEVSQTLLGNLYQDPADFFFKKNSSERQFFSVPVGGNTPDLVEYAENLYGNKYVCKGGSIYAHTGVKYTDDSLHCGPGHSVPYLTGFGSLG